MRLRLVKQQTAFDFFDKWKFWLGLSAMLVVLSIASTVVQGLNFGIDFKGGTTIRAESSTPINVAAYRQAIEPLALGDVSIAEVFDPSFRADQNVVQIRIQAQDGQEAVASDLVAQLETALRNIAPDIRFPSVESVGPKVSGELIKSAVLAIIIAIAVVLIYIWLRFEWQFALGAVGALVHDVILTIGIFSALQIKFDLAIIAALLTIVGYSLNDTVVVFDRVRENL
ncbi:MAG: protein translocase subunit SecF, partial [Planktomarina sp.]|nr:protein translocase subunit SecF [Planktomarina sp.]